MPTETIVPIPVQTAPRGCTKCAALCGRERENVVQGELTGDYWGEGVPLNRDLPIVMLLGRSPDGVEDNLGRPFVGRSGKVLRDIVKPMEGMNAVFYWDNMVKCHTPGNRGPYEDEYDNCSEYVSEALLIVKPDAVVLFGMDAQERWGFKKEERGVVRVMKLDVAEKLYHRHGDRHPISWESQDAGVPVIATYHPSYVSREKSARGEIEKDIWTAIRIGQTHRLHRLLKENNVEAGQG